VNDSAGSLTKVFHRRKGNAEVNFVLEKGGKVTVLEVKSGRRRTSLPGMAAFHRAFNEKFYSIASMHKRKSVVVVFDEFQDTLKNNIAFVSYPQSNGNLDAR